VGLAQVREEGKNLGVELYRWLGAMFKAEVENNKDLKPAQVRGGADHVQRV
jgi:hypothetical protein